MPIITTLARATLVAFTLSIPDADAASPLPQAPNGDTAGSVVADNLDTALQILAESTRAHGGAAWIRGTRGVALEFEGRYSLQAHLERPWAAHEFEVQGTFEHAPPFDALRKRVRLQRGHALETFCALNGDRGIARDFGRPVAAQLTPEEVAARWRKEREWLPQEFLRQATAARTSLSYLGPTDTHDLIQYRPAEGGPRLLLLGREDHLLHRVERLVHFPSKGDRLEWREFRGYQAVGDVQVPRELHLHTELATTQEDWALSLHSVHVDPPTTIEELVLPGPYRSAAPNLHLRRHPPLAEDRPLPHTSLGAGVYALSLAEVNARCLLIEFKDHCVVWESGGSSAVAERILRTAESLCPGKPVRYLVMSHHHRISASGLRPYVQRGIRLLGTPGNRDYLQDLATRPYRLEPDAQAGAPQPLHFTGLEGRHVLADGDQEIEIIPFATSTHTDEYLLLHLPRLRTVAVGDLLYLPAGAGSAPTGPRSQALLTGLKALELPVGFILQAFPLDERYLSVRIPDATTVPAHGPTTGR